MKRSVLIPINDETSEREKTADKMRVMSFKELMAHRARQSDKTAVRFCQFIFYWEHSETVLEVVNKSSLVNSLDEAEKCADYVRKRMGLPLKELPRERNY